MGLLTGNVERGARLKLGRFGLNRYFEFGGFASDAEDRTGIARIALKRGLQRATEPVALADVLVIGDTPRDIACGRAVGATTVAVATGPHSVQELAPHEPDRLLEDFSDLDRSLATLLE
jgi:phosphoglycolate phosphatase-like HAD superfamily hydrolase